MKCLRCRYENRSGAKFCEECAAPLARACPNCSSQVSATAKFCPECAHPIAAPSAEPRFVSPDSYTPKNLAEKILTSRAALEGERKQVTVLFADVKGSMELLADRDPEEARKILDPVLERMMEAVHRYEGTVNQVMGDGIMALFGAPLAHEDHAVRACYAALRMQESVKKYADEVRRSHAAVVKIRVGLNSGEVVVRAIGSDLHMDYTAVGQTTHLAARMEQLADPGAIVITPDTLGLAEGYVEVTSLGLVPVKGLADALETYEVTGAGSARTRLQVSARRGLTRFVGRDAELEQLRRVQQLAGNGHGQVATIVGEAGVGKSRLLYEFTHSHRLQGWLVLESASVSYAKATSYLPVIDLLKGYFKVQDRDDLREIREKVTGKLLTLDRALEPALPALLALLDVPADDTPWQALDPAQRRQHTLDAVRQLLLREAQEQPLLLIVEDLHWIDGETQALLDGLVESLGSARLLLLVNYRPEYQHPWGSKTYYSQMRLDALPVESAGELLEALLGEDPGLLPLKQLLVRRGNPFFLEETVRTLVETKALVGGARPVSADTTGPGDPGLPHGPSDPGGAHRPTRPRRQAPAAGSRRRWPRRSLRPPSGHHGGARGHPARGSRSAPGRRVHLRGAPLSRRRVHVQARPHPRGRLRGSPPRSPSAAPCRHRRSHGAPLRRSPERAGGAVSASRGARGSVGEGRDLPVAGRTKCQDPVGVPPGGGLPRAGGGGPDAAARDR